MVPFCCGLRMPGGGGRDFGASPSNLELLNHVRLDNKVRFVEIIDDERVAATVKGRNGGSESRLCVWHLRGM